VSFILSFIRAPGLQSVQQAADYISQQPVPAPEPTRHFAAFVERVSEYFPDLSDDADARDRNLWPEGLDHDELNGPVVNVLINTDLLDPGVMSVIARQAILSGLQVLDEQNGLLYGPGFLSVDMDGGMPKRLDEVTPYARSVMTENIRGLGLRDSQQRVARALADALGDGFAEVGGSHETFVRRSRGDIHQIISIGVMRSVEVPGRARVYARLGFASDTLAERWLRLLPADFGPRRERFDLSEGGRAMQFVWYLRDLTQGSPAQTVTLKRGSDMLFSNRSDLDQLIAAASAWAATQLRPYLDGIGDVADLQRLFINDASLQHFGQDRLHFPCYVSMLTLAQGAGRDTLAAYAAACRENPDLQRVCTLFKDAEGAHVDSLITGLQALPSD
jgi:hypothetical protein